jgi:hypothetical protein
MYSGCSSGKESQGDLQVLAHDKVSEFLNIMITDQRPKTLMDFISASYIKAAGISVDQFSVNTYYPKTFVIERTFASPDLAGAMNIVAKISGANNGFVHRLTFVVFNDNGVVSFYPGAHDMATKYVDPWFKSEENIK